MKKKLKCLLILFSILPQLSCSQETDQPEWKLTWEENFDQTKGFDTSCWSKIPRGKSDWDKYMSDFDSCYAVVDGNLILRGLANYTLPNDTAPYITGGLYTKNKVSFTYGKLEIRARLQGAKGAWPAIWMLPQDGKWPFGGEIDIMERLNSDAIAYQTIHTNYTYVLGKKNNPKNGSTGPIDPTGYNTYAVEITPDSLVFSINEKRTFSYPNLNNDKEGQYPFGKPFYLLIDMQLGGNWVGTVNPADVPVEMKVDWVRYYMREQ